MSTRYWKPTRPGTPKAAEESLSSADSAATPSDAVDRVHGARQSAQAKSLEARLAEVSAQTPWAGGAAAPPADRKGKDDWARWSETFDRVDGEEGILDALRVRAPRAEKRPPFVHCIHSFVRAILSSSLRLVSE